MRQVKNKYNKNGFTSYKGDFLIRENNYVNDTYNGFYRFINIIGDEVFIRYYWNNDSFDTLFYKFRYEELLIIKYTL